MDDPRSPAPDNFPCGFTHASVRAERERLVARAIKSGQNRTDAEDGVQAAFLTLWTRASLGDAPEEVRPWLSRCSWNLCRLQHRNNLRRKEVHALAAHVSPDATDALDPTVLDIHRQCAALPRLLAALSPRSRDVLLAHVVDGDSFPMIAQRFGMTIITTRRTLHRALAALRAHGVALALWQSGDCPEDAPDW